MRKRTVVVSTAAVFVSLTVGALASTVPGPTGGHHASAKAKDSATGKRGKRGPRGLRGLRGPRGFDGAAGPAGPAGPAGAVRVVQVVGPDVVSCAGPGTVCNVQSSKAECPAGTAVSGGGYDTGVRDFISSSKPSGNGWFVIAVNTSEFAGSHVQAFATCTSVTSPSLLRKADAKDTAAERAKLAAVRAEEAAAR